MTTNNQLEARDPWAPDAGESTARMDAVAPARPPLTIEPEVAPIVVAGPPTAGPPTAGPPTAGPPTAGAPKPRTARRPKMILVAAVLVTAIASSGITAAVMSAIGGTAAPAVSTQDGTMPQGRPGGGGMPGGVPRDQEGQADQGTQQGTTEQEQPGTTGT